MPFASSWLLQVGDVYYFLSLYLDIAERNICVLVAKNTYNVGSGAAWGYKEGSDGWGGHWRPPACHAVLVARAITSCCL